MLFCDVNIYVYAMRPETSDRAERVRHWLENALSGAERVGINELALSAMTRIVTQHRVFDRPSTPEQCMTFADSVLRAPAADVVRPSSRHWAHFADLVTGLRLRGTDIPDAYLASLAMEHGATLVTLDHGFARFPDLRTLDPLA